MKKFILMVVLAVASVMIYAQPRAIGGRLGAFNGISYQHGFGDKNMLEVELGWSVDGRTDFWRNVGGVQTHGRTWGTTVQAAATYDWIDPFPRCRWSRRLRLECQHICCRSRQRWQRLELGLYRCSGTHRH